MNLLRDVLDQQIIDCKQRKAGKVDGVVIEIRENAPPRVAYLEAGADVLARRLSARLERFVTWFDRRQKDHDPPFRIPWSKIENVSVSVKVSLDVTEYSHYHLENWLRDHIINRIPGNAHHKHQERND